MAQRGQRVQVGGVGERLLACATASSSAPGRAARPASGRTDRCGRSWRLSLRRTSRSDSLRSARLRRSPPVLVRCSGKARQPRRPPTGGLAKRRWVHDELTACDVLARRALCSGRSVQADRRGRSQVQALGAPVDRHPHPGVGRRRPAPSGRPCASEPNSQAVGRRAGRRRPGRRGRRRRARRRRAPRSPAAAQRRDRGRGRRRRGPRRRGTGCRRWPARTCRCTGRRCRPAKTTARRAGRVGGAQHRAGVARVGIAGEHHHQRGPASQHRARSACAGAGRPRPRPAA